LPVETRAIIEMLLALLRLLPMARTLIVLLIRRAIRGPLIGRMLLRTGCRRLLLRARRICRRQRGLRGNGRRGSGRGHWNFLFRQGWLRREGLRSFAFDFEESGWGNDLGLDATLLGMPNRRRSGQELRLLRWRRSGGFFDRRTARLARAADSCRRGWLDIRRGFRQDRRFGAGGFASWGRFAR
jgi:hypothetical protein